jgi:FAD binding domain-containing protein
MDIIAEGTRAPMTMVANATPANQCGTVRSNGYRSLIRERALPRRIMVNAAGRRFTDEASPYNDVGKALHGRDQGGCPNDPAYLVFDAGYLARYPLPGVPSGGPAPDWIARSGSVRGLAGAIGVDPDGLERTVAAWDQACATGRDPGFGRGDGPGPHRGGHPGHRPVRGRERGGVLDRGCLSRPGRHPRHRDDLRLPGRPPRGSP